MANPTMRKCVVDACEDKHDSHGYCAKHSFKVKRHGSAYGPFKPSRVAQPCGVEGCDFRRARQGYCHKHFSWKQRTGDASVRPVKAEYVQKSIKNKRSNYKWRTVKNHPILGSKTILEHRLIMAEFLNRELTLTENIHHINGDGKDNRIENLELWSISQPPGQRVEDKINWAIKFLKEYKPEALKEEI